MPCNDEGIPTKPKMSQLIIVSDKSRGILGKCDLDLTKFSYDDFNVLRLNLSECQYEGSWIEVGLKAVSFNRSINRTPEREHKDKSDIQIDRYKQISYTARATKPIWKDM